MGRKTFTAEQIIFKLREVEVLVGQGESIANACRKIAEPSRHITAGAGNTAVWARSSSRSWKRKTPGCAVSLQI